MTKYLAREKKYISMKSKRIKKILKNEEKQLKT